MRTSTRAIVDAASALLVTLLAGACDRTPAARAEVAAAEAHMRALEATLARDSQRTRAEVDVTGSTTTPGCQEHEFEIARLRTELGRLEQHSVERELEWQRYLETLRSFELPAMPADFEADVPREQGPPVPPPAPVDETLARRSEELERTLRTLLAIEGVRGIDLFEAGSVHDDESGGWIGPVVFRLLDERGRLAGSLVAERLRLEGSRAARTLTIVLEDGHESRAGERMQFPPDDTMTVALDPVGTRRFVLFGVDPMPWVSAAPELFGSTPLDQPKDDGRWNVEFVRGTLNRLMREDAAQGYWRIKSLAGIHDGALRDVHLEGFDRDGKLERRAFADRLSVLAQDRGVLLLLEEGAVERGDERAPFLDGRFRVFLPRAKVDAWRKAGIPGLAEPPADASARKSD